MKLIIRHREDDMLDADEAVSVVVGSFYMSVVADGAAEFLSFENDNFTLEVKAEAGTHERLLGLIAADRTGTVVLDLRGPDASKWVYDGTNTLWHHPIHDGKMRLYVSRRYIDEMRASSVDFVTLEQCLSQALSDYMEETRFNV